MSSHRSTALTAGLLYLATFVTSIPALALKGPFLNDPAFVLGSGSAASVLAGAALELLLAVACIGTAVTLYPVLRRHAEALALGFVAARIVEATLVVTGALAVFSALTLRRASTGLDDAQLTSASTLLVTVHDWTFLVGPGLIPAVNALLLGTVLFRAHLVPRWIPVVGLVGAPLLLISASASVLGVVDQTSPLAGAAALPIAVWELSLGLWLTFRGFLPAGATRRESWPFSGRSLHRAPRHHG